MSTAKRNRGGQLTFEDLNGLRAEGYVRDSTLDQKDGFGPEIQHNNIERFAESYGLVLGGRWYTEFVSGRHSRGRSQFQQFLTDARLDLFDVLLVDHTSRFGRNQAECIRHKEELQGLGKVVVFVSQGIISGSDRDFIAERINETLDEQYSRNLSRYISAGLSEKTAHGLAVGPTALGYKSETLAGRKGERKVPNPKTMPILLSLLRDYSTGGYSYRDVAERLNAQGFRTATGQTFREASIRDVLSNRFYDGKVVYHAGKSDELITEGVHEVSEEVKDLWVKCQEIKQSRSNTTTGHPRGPVRHFPFSQVLNCHRCGSPYYGESHPRGEYIDMRMSHERRGPGRSCKPKPRSRSVDALVDQMGDRVMPHLQLDASWKTRIISALKADEPPHQENHQQGERLQRALENLRKQHKWGDISDEEYRSERNVLVRQLKLLDDAVKPRQLPNLERAAEFLQDLPRLWLHPGGTHEEREALVKQVFQRITIDGKDFVDIEPKPEYATLFATIATGQKVGYRETDSSPSPP